MLKLEASCSAAEAMARSLEFWVKVGLLFREKEAKSFC
jgi:hypothetical protein